VTCQEHSISLLPHQITSRIYDALSMMYDEEAVSELRMRLITSLLILFNNGTPSFKLIAFLFSPYFELNNSFLP
jgi:hypothetical protein